MANDRIDTMLATHEQQPELMLSNVLHLMSHYHADAACPKLASVIERHLRVLSGLPNLAPVLQATCQQLSQQWASLVEVKPAQPAKGSLLERLDRLVNPKRTLPLAQ
ncbi:hypothetical protein [Janthinobacterium psychrotolerans]|uniref:Uncharacterized protein n=1 Tax=Janthinobacterium psychrotolerans TaxID=1747903 RepID=A0A1A7BWZ3_9BURK|nr:hypothetical protein [Janthinobacterium psychrotolerans]OBV36648.1 hypothetical protein ASR47_1001120 [Janthinobacterium psychrotolerans]